MKCRGNLQFFYKTIIKTLFWVLIISFIVVATIDASIYMPNEIDDEYTYKDSFGTVSTSEVVFTCGRKWRKWTQFAGFGPVWVWTNDKSERVYIFANGRLQLFVNFNAQQGSSWNINVGSCNKNVKIVLVAFDEIVIVPAGTFYGCILIDVGLSCNDAGVSSIWFAPNVGVVKWKSLNIAGPITSELTLQ